MAKVYRHKDLDQGLDPMGESLLDSKQAYRVWVPDHLGVVLGNSQKPEIELTLSQIESDQVPIYKRRGGGGTVLLSPQGLCYGLRFKKSKDKSIHDYFEMGTSVLENVLWKKFKLESSMKGISDLAIGDLKILGCSLYLPRDYALFLASVLIEDESDSIEKYLAYPSREPDYRAGRSHKDFITSIWDTLDDPQRDQMKSPRELQSNILTWLEDEIKEEWVEELFLTI